MRYIHVLLALMILAGCSAGGGAIVSRPVSAEFAKAAPDAIEVEVKDRQPVETAELVAPDGSATPAYQIDRSKVVESYAPEPAFGVGVFGGSSGHIGTSVGINIPIGRSDTAPYEPVIESRALIRVPDMAAYRSNWQNWKIRIELGTSETNERVMEIPAPRPPEG